MGNWLDKYSKKEEAATGTNWLEKYADLRSDTEGTAESDMSDTETITPLTDAEPGALSVSRSPDERTGLFEKIYRPLAGGFVGSLGAMTSGAGFGVKWLADNNQIISDEDAARLASMTHGENVTSDDMAFHRRSPVADVLLQEGQRTRELGSDIGWVSNPNLVSDTAGALGSMAAYYIPTLIAAPLAGAAAANGRFLATPLGVKAADMAARGAAWLVHAGTEALSNAGGAYNDLAADGVEDSKAMTAAKRDFFTNYLIKLATEPVGALGGRLGSIPGVKGRMARGFAEALSEGFVEEPLQNLSSNAAKKSLDETYGGFLENLLGEFRDNYVNEVMNVGAPSAIAGGIMGAVLPGDVQALGRVNVKGKPRSEVDSFMDGIAGDIENASAAAPQNGVEGAIMGEGDTEGVSRKFVPDTRLLGDVINSYRDVMDIPEGKRSEADRRDLSAYMNIFDLYASGQGKEAVALARELRDTETGGEPKAAAVPAQHEAPPAKYITLEQQQENVGPPTATDASLDGIQDGAANIVYDEILRILNGTDTAPKYMEAAPPAPRRNMKRATPEPAVPEKAAPSADVDMESFARVREHFVKDFRRLNAADPESLNADDRHKFEMLNQADNAYSKGDFQRTANILAQLYGAEDAGLRGNSSPIAAKERATSELAVPTRKIDVDHAYVGAPKPVPGGYQIEKTDGTKVYVPVAIFGDYYQVTPPRNQPVPKSKRVVNGYAVGDVFQSTDGGAYWVTKVEPKKITLTDGAGKSRAVSLGTMAKSKLTRLSPEHRGDTHYSLTPGYSRTPLYGVRGEEVGERFAGARERIQEETPADKSPERVVGGPVANESTANGSKPDVEDYAAEKADKSATPKEYKYYLHARPAGPGAVPNGLTRIDAGDGGDRYGAVYYDRELSAKEVSDYELVPAEDGGGNQKEGESANNKKEPVKNELASDENVKPEAEEVKPAELSAFAVAKKSPARRISEKQRTAAGKSVQAAAKKASDMQGYYTDEAGRQVFTDTRAVFRLSKPVEGLEAAGANASWSAKVASLFEHAEKEESVTLGREEIAEIVARGKMVRGKKAAEVPEFVTKVGQAYVDSARLGEVLSVLGADEVTVYTSKPRADESGRGYYYSNVYFTSENGEALLAPVNLRDAGARAVDAYYKGISTPVNEKTGTNESQKKGNGGVSQEEPPVGKPAEKIADFGEKIGGARKDFAALYRQSIEAKYSDEDVAKRPLSEVFPAPDYDKMVESGADKRSMAIVRAIRDAIPAKPRGSFKMPGYVRAVKSAREIASKIMSDPDYASEAMARMGQVSTTQHGILDKAALYEEMGHGASLKDYSIRSVITSEANGKKYEEPTRVWMVRKSGRTVAYGESLSEAAGALREYLAKDGAPQGRKPDYAVYIQRSSGKDGYYVGKKVGRDYAELAGPFAKLSEADAYMRDHPEELARKLNNFKATPSERREVNAPRIGADMRGGRDVTPEMFSSAFGFRGVEFGNWVEQGKRQADLNEAYDSLMDMAAIIGVPPKALSLNGKLGLAFGARGKGGKDSAKAHYEPDRAAINLTKAHGAGSLAHEWMHAVDDYFAKAGGKRDMISGSSEVYTASKGREPKDIPGVRPEMVRAFGEVRRAITESEMPKRAAALDKRRSKPYWATETELQSRAFEAYIAEKLAADGASNDYLVNIVSEEYWQAQNALLEKEGLDDFPYPKSGEMPAVSRAFDNFFKTVKTRETDKGVEMYRLAPTARAQLDADAAAFAKQVDAFVAKKMKPQQELTVMQTPLVLQISDERVKALPVVMSQRTLAKIFRKHNLSPALVKQIPGAMADPIMVLKSEGKPGQVQDGFVVMFELRDAKGNTINVPVALNVEHYGPNGKYECNDIVSAYGRESSLTGKPYDEWFLKQAQKPGLLKYINTKKFSRWVNQTRLVVPERKTNGRSIENIPVGDESVNTKKFSRWVDETGLALPGTAVKTEADLAKAQDANPGAYALGAAERTGLPALSVADVAARVKGAKVSDLGEGKMKLEFSNGTAWIVDTQAEAIFADPEIVKRDYGREVRPGEAISGRTRVIDGQRFIDLVAGMSDARTFSHEVFESAWDSLTKEEQAAVLKTHGSRESAAEMYGEFLEGRVAKLSKRTQAIFQRLKDFFSAIRATLFGRNSEDVFREIASGKALNREIKDISRAERYRRAYAAMQDIVSGADEAIIREARSDISHYGGTNDVTLVWGNSKKGLAHIGGKRGAEVAGNIVRTVLDGQVLKYVKAKKTLHLGWNGHEAVLSLDENGKSKTWLLTGCIQDRPDAIGEVGTQSNATHNRPTFSRSDMGAGLKTIVEQYTRLVNVGGPDAMIANTDWPKKKVPSGSDIGAGPGKILERNDAAVDGDGAESLGRPIPKAEVDSFVSGLTLDKANIKKVDPQLIFKTNKMPPGDMLALSMKEVERLGKTEIATPLGEKVYFAPGNTEDLKAYTLHMVAGMDKSLNDIRRGRVYGLFTAEETLKDPLAILRQENGRTFYVSLYDAKSGNMMNGVIVGVEEGQNGRVVTSIIQLDKSSSGNKAIRELKKHIQNAKDVLYLWKGQSGHPRPPTDQHSSLPDVGLPMSGRNNVAQNAVSDNTGEAAGRGYEEHYRLGVRRDVPAEESGTNTRQTEDMGKRAKKPITTKLEISSSNRKASEMAAEDFRKANPDAEITVTDWPKKETSSGVVVEKNAQWLRDMGTAELERVVRPSRQDESVKDKVVHAVTDFHRNYRNWVDVLDPLNKFGENIFHEAEKQVYGAANKAEQIIRTELLPIYDKLNPGEHDGAMAYATYVHLNDIAANSEKAALMADELEAKAKEKQREISEDKKLSSPDKADLSEWKRRVAAMQAERDLYVSQAKALRDAVKITAGKEEAYSRAIKKIEAHYPHWVKFQKELAEFSNKELAKLRNAGIVSKEMYERMRELYPNYVPLQRDFGVDEKSVDGFVGGMGLVNLQNPVKKLKGSKRDIIDPTEQILKNVYAYESLVGRQKVGRMIMEKYDAGDFHDLIEEVKNRHHEPNEMVWHVWDNGKKRFFKSNIDIYNALMPKRAGKYDDMLFVRASKWLTKLLRAGVTHDLTYVLRNPVRDQWAYSVVASDVGYVPFVDFARGLAQCFHKDAGSLYDEFMKAGGASGLAGMTKNTQKEWLREIRKEKGSVLVESLKNPPKALYRLLGELSETTELASRMGVYMKAKKAGMSSEDAALKARDVMNFNRFGVYGEGVNQHVAFFNGAVQGEDVVLRSLFKGGKPNKRAFLAAFMYITGMTMLQTLFNYSDDDKRREYLDLPMWRKATCWTFVIDKGDDDYFRLSIPKPQGLLGMLFGTLPALFMDYAHEKDSRVFNGMMSAFVESTTPEFYPLSFLVMAELGANHSFFYDREIVPKREQRFEPRLQYGPYTSELAKAVGGKLNISPRLIEHAALSIGGGLTKSVSNMLDNAIRAYNGENRPSRPWYESYPGVRGFFAPEGHASSDNFQAELEMLQKKRNSAEETLKTKGAKALTETERRLLRASEDIKALSKLNSGKGGIYDAYSVIRGITTATNIDADEKRRRISRIYSNIDNASKRGLQKIDRINAYLDR